MDQQCWSIKISTNTQINGGMYTQTDGAVEATHRWTERLMSRQTNGAKGGSYTWTEGRNGGKTHQGRKVRTDGWTGGMNSQTDRSVGRQSNGKRAECTHRWMDKR